MKVLHLCKDYHNTDLYNQLIKELSNFDINQTLYTAVNTNLPPFENKSDLRNVNLITSSILIELDRIFYHRKIKKIYKDL